MCNVIMSAFAELQLVGAQFCSSQEVPYHHLTVLSYCRLGLWASWVSGPLHVHLWLRFTYLSQHPSFHVTVKHVTHSHIFFTFSLHFPRKLYSACFHLLSAFGILTCHFGFCLKGNFSPISVWFLWLVSYLCLTVLSYRLLGLPSVLAARHQPLSSPLWSPATAPLLNI